MGVENIMASGDRIAFLLMENAKQTTTAFATYDIVLDGSTVVGVFSVLGFPGATADTYGDFLIDVVNYAGGGFSLTPYFWTDGTVTNAIQFEARAKKFIATEVATAHNLGAQTATDITETPSATADALQIATPGTITHANSGSPVNGDLLRIRVGRDFDHAVNADSLQLLAILVKEV